MICDLLSLDLLFINQNTSSVPRVFSLFSTRIKYQRELTEFDVFHTRGNAIRMLNKQGEDQESLIEGKDTKIIQLLLKL